ncbi:hypothetical protein FR943_21515 [Mycobacterium sp. TNTM28]|uniref:Uncharacterized protein n=1 Tax=[Mycobacterium] fortunisiensis TaxID=2600579 RepID=A0ABS6KRZ7_9MYCO|nr:hypothetical protein [[Mycobacterium] fortunisiensis]MBU9766410.1 hypothetical protein [[Mycobacterium] fortunisiensis]
MSVPGPAGRQHRLTWVLGATSVVLAIALAVVAGLHFAQPREAGDSVRAAAATSPEARWASAGDTAAVSIVTEDPTCGEWTRISASLVEVQNRVLWFDRDGSIAAVEWSPEQAAMYSTVATAMGSVVVQTSRLARQTPHRVMREAYGQLVAYAQELINRIPQYQPADIDVARTADAMVGAVSSICAAASGSAPARAPLPPAALPPTAPPPAPAAIDRRTMMADNPSICAEWLPMSANHRYSVADHTDADWQTPAVDWTFYQQSAGAAVGSLDTEFADESEQLSRRSNNPVVEDLVVLAAQYLRAHALALPTYAPADRALADVAGYLTKAIDSACAAVV